MTLDEIRNEQTPCYPQARIVEFEYPSDLYDFYEDEIRNIKPQYQPLLQLCTADAQRAFRTRSQLDFRDYGDPLPNNIEEAMQRTTFQRMEYFEDRYNELQPFFVGLRKMSTAIIEKPKMIFTQREIGEFNISRFMMGIDPVMGFYSKKRNKYFRQEIVFFNPKSKKIIDKDDIKFNPDKTYSYKKDNSECIKTSNVTLRDKEYYFLEDDEKLDYVQFQENGRKKYSTRNKKVYFAKEIIKRPFKSVRIFVSCGNNWGDEIVNIGIAAASIIRFLSTLGYQIRVTAVFGYHKRKATINIPNGEQNVSNGYAINIVDVKRYEEPLDLKSLLYIMSDKTFFRVKYFRYLVGEQSYFNDQYDATLGTSVSAELMKEILISKMKSDAIKTEKNTLYYFIGGRDCETLEQMQNNIIRVVIESEVDNLRALRDIGRADFTDDELEEIRREKKRELEEIQRRINPEIADRIANIRI